MASDEAGSCLTDAQQYEEASSDLCWISAGAKEAVCMRCLSRSTARPAACSSETQRQTSQHSSTEAVFSTRSGASGFSYSESIPALHVPLLADIQRSVHKHLKERQPCCLMDLPGIKAILIHNNEMHRRDEAGDADQPSISKKPSHLSNAPNVLFTVLWAEA
ncbi:hypothetical protein EYF80_034719 [Liparis tanakae]|uniref:Uncharacterized protein n=1 Tax=Liparis tanakae TaxID=230148 RepID=A0A4Z2GQL5_9TELE|nr:hypothetical protein EYF80_034719 [Liparis tanakae]